jgi:hypothetical protein
MRRNGRAGNDVIAGSEATKQSKNIGETPQWLPTKEEKPYFSSTTT